MIQGRKHSNNSLLRVFLTKNRAKRDHLIVRVFVNSYLKHTLIKKILLYYHTLRYLKRVQIRYRLRYALRGRLRSRSGFKYNFLPEIPAVQPLQFQTSILAYTSRNVEDNSFTFLNIKQNFEEIDWNFAQHGKLWTYNLNYFDFINQEYTQLKDTLKLMEGFTKKLPELKDALEPFPISLRIMNWVKFLSKNNIQDHKLQQSLYAQTQILLDNLEYHILGNHLLENGFALLFAAYYFKEEKFYQQAKRILVPELETQILEDGAHFELAPMYHQLMLYRVLDCVNLVQNNPELFAQELLKILRSKAAIMLGWLQQISFKDGTIPHFNDSTDGIAPSTSKLLQYAQLLNISNQPQQLGASGYRAVETANYEARVDIAKVGPDHIPAHAHSDALHIVLQVKGQALLVDTGISTYEKNARRNIERVTASHNTVQFDNFEQSEVWGGFRVARRVYPLIEQDETTQLQARVRYTTTKAMHRRRFEFMEDSILIRDECESETVSKAHFHFHPDVAVTLEGRTIKTPLATIQIENAKDIQLENYSFALAYNQLTRATKAIITFDKTLTTNIQT